MDASTKATLSALLNQVRTQQVELGELRVSLDAALDVLKASDPRFEGEHEMRTLSSDRDTAKQATASIVSLIDVAISSLQQSETEN